MNDTICGMDLSKLLQGCNKVITYISRPLSNKTKLKFYKDFNTC